MGAVLYAVCNHNLCPLLPPSGRGILTDVKLFHHSLVRRIMHTPEQHNAVDTTSQGVPEWAVLCTSRAVPKLDPHRFAPDVPLSLL